MKVRSWMLCVLSVLLVLVALLLFAAAAGSAYLDGIAKATDDAARPLINRTDLQAILQACNAVLSDPQAAGFPKGEITSVSGSQGGMSPPPAALPAVLSNLHFESMVLRDRHAEIWFGGGFGGWGYSTAPIWNGRGAVVPGAKHLELIPGLWFWTQYDLPRDLSKQSYYVTCKWLLAGGILVLIGAITAAVYGFKTKTPA